MQDCLACHVTVTLTAGTSAVTFLAKFRTVSFRTRIIFVPWFYFFTNIEFLLSYLVSQRVRELHTKCNRHDAAPALLNMCGQIVDKGVATGQGSCLSVLGEKSIKHDHNQMHLWMLVGSCMSGIETRRWEDFVFLLFISSCVLAREFFHLVVMPRDILQYFCAMNIENTKHKTKWKHVPFSDFFTFLASSVFASSFVQREN